MTGKTFFSRPLFISFLLAFSFVFSQWIHPAPARSAKAPAEKVPGSILRWPEKGPAYMILVDKSLQKVFLYHQDSPHKPSKTYVCSTGENEGPKLQRNDRKTPEGIYFFTREYKQRELAPRYGTRAFALDYPNPVDRRDGKGGYGIWFHGLDKPLKPRDTNGCVAFANKDIDELAPIIRLRDTPVVISSQVRMVDPDELEKEQKDILRLIETWQGAWQNKQIDKYMSTYCATFHSSGKNWHQWKTHKTRLARQYKTIRVEIRDLLILRNDGLVLAGFTQKYSNEHFDSVGRKTLFLRQNSAQWKIIGEYFDSTEVLPVTAQVEPSAFTATAPALKGPSGPVKPPAPEVKTASLLAQSDTAEIKNLLSRWKKAWEGKNLGAYMACYDLTFQSGGMDLKAWKVHKQKLNRRYRSIAVAIEDLTIEQASPAVATAAFRQTYKADDYRDDGLKNLLLVKRGDMWRIKKEEWRPLDKASRP
jgi:murein L,D-transpeptidase YafK